jgi:putative transposon-encoded protein
MPRKVTLQRGELVLSEDEIEGFLEGYIKPLGTSARFQCPKRYIGRRAYLVVCKD